MKRHRVALVGAQDAQNPSQRVAILNLARKVARGIFARLLPRPVQGVALHVLPAEVVAKQVQSNRVEPAFLAATPAIKGAPLAENPLEGIGQHVLCEDTVACAQGQEGQQ